MKKNFTNRGMFKKVSISVYVFLLIMISLTLIAVSPRSLIPFKAEAYSQKNEASPRGSSASGINQLSKEGDSLMKTRTLAGYRDAYVKYKSALSAHPGNPDLMIKTAASLNCIMRVLTNGNQIRIDGKTQETDENYEIWRTLGKEAEVLARTAYKQRPDQLDSLIVFSESYMYYSSTFGILRAIIVGTVWTYIDNGNKIIRLFPTHDYGLGYLCMGVYYMMVPWPLSDMDEAKNHFDKALEVSAESVRNHYYLGLWAFKKKDYRLAERELKFVLENPCTDGSELDFCGFMKSEAKRGLSIIKKQL